MQRMQVSPAVADRQMQVRTRHPPRIPAQPKQLSGINLLMGRHQTSSKVPVSDLKAIRFDPDIIPQESLITDIRHHSPANRINRFKARGQIDAAVKISPTGNRVNPFPVAGSQPERRQWQAVLSGDQIWDPHGKKQHQQAPQIH